MKNGLYTSAGIGLHHWACGQCWVASDLTTRLVYGSLNGQWWSA